ARPTVVYAAAAVAAQRLGQLAAEATVAATGRTQVGTQNWYRIAYQGREGWIAAPSMREIDPAELPAWSRARDSRDPAALEDFLRAHPRGYFAERARQNLLALRNQDAPRQQA